LVRGRGNRELYNMSNFIKLFSKVVALTLLTVIAVGSLVTFAEPERVGAVSASDSVIVTLNVESGIAITSPPDTTMSTSLGVTADTAVATTTWNVRTNNNAGYSMTLHASTFPAMKSGSNYVDDYATTTMPSVWSVASGNAKFGFSVFGTDVSTATWGTGSFCNGAATSTPSSTLKYYGFSVAAHATSTATRSSTTTPSGIDTVVCYAVEQDGMYIPSGVYTATITATATTL
jgi:hypothetical protein